MRQGDLQTRELDDDSHQHPTPHTPPAPPMNWRTGASAAFAALAVVALIAAVFVAISAAPRPGKSGAQALASVTPVAALTSTAVATPPAQALTHGAGLPEGVEVITFTLTGADEGWGTGGVITNPVDGVPDRGMVLHYANGAWTQVGSSLPGVYLGGIDMLSSSEGWVMGGDGSDNSVLLHIRDGAWQKMALPAIDPHGAPAVMAMRTPDEGWLAMANPKGAQGGANTSLLHYRGGVWSLVSNTPHYITDIAPIADGEAWVIGWNADETSSLVHVQGGVATVELNSPGYSSFDRLRMFAPNDIWIEGAMHAASNAEIDDVPLNYHYDGVTWSNVNLHVPNGAQHVGIVSSKSAWSFTSEQLPSPVQSSYGDIATIFSNAGGQWSALSLPYTDLQSLNVVSTSSTDVWAIGTYMVTTQIPSDNGGQSFSSVGHTVLLRYTNGAWTEWGR
ncbi:MAG TPA: hypothetical protein VF739_09025 [Ktedonobacterales bacterium]